MLFMHCPAFCLLRLMDLVLHLSTALNFHLPELSTFLSHNVTSY